MLAASGPVLQAGRPRVLPPTLLDLLLYPQRHVGARGEVVPLPVPDRLVDEADVLGIRYGAIGPIETGNMGAVDAAEADAADGEGREGPALSLPSGGVFGCGAKIFELGADDAQLTREEFGIGRVADEDATVRARRRRRRQRRGRRRGQGGVDAGFGFGMAGGGRDFGLAPSACASGDGSSHHALAGVWVLIKTRTLSLC